jgi:hypothetical protein
MHVLEIIIISLNYWRCIGWITIVCETIIFYLMDFFYIVMSFFLIAVFSQTSDFHPIIGDSVRQDLRVSQNQRLIEKFLFDIIIIN